MNGVISISMENTKMGPIPSFSLPPRVTCNPNSPCVKKGCYATKIYRIRKSVREAWDKNLSIVQRDNGDWQRQLNGWLSIYQPKAFRIHVSGDFFCEKYLKQWVEIASDNPKVSFFAFTKQWNILRCYISNKSLPKIPRNLSIILSAWIPDCNGWCPPEELIKKFPVAWIERKARDIAVISDTLNTIGIKKRSVAECGGRCSTCGRCFRLKKKDGDILFQYH